MLTSPLVAGALLALVHAAAPPVKLDVQILSATAKDKVVPGAQVIFQKDGRTSLTGSSDAQGKVSVPNGFRVDDGSVSLIVKKEGYSPLVVKCPCNGMSYALSETLLQPDAFRVVLSWGRGSGDLDLHAVFRKEHVWWQSKAGADAFLDVDDTDGAGPETVTIRKRNEGDTYVFGVHDFSANGRYGTDALSARSQAKAFVYVGQSLIRSYYVPAGKKGALWVLFAVDGKGAFHDIDNVTDIAEYDKVPTYLGQIAARSDFGASTRASVSDAEGARELAQRAEEALRAGDAERSVELFQLALGRNPILGAVYSGLARAYGTLNRPAEAAWATRKGEEIARAPATRFRIPNDRITLSTSSSMKNWKQYSFGAGNLVDDNLWTSWQPVTKPGGGVGEWVNMTFATPQSLTGLEISNGFRRIDDKFGDLYHMNNRIKTATLECSDGTRLPIELADEPVERTVSLPAPIRCSWVKLTVDSVYRGTKWNDLAVSELHPLAKAE